MFRNINMDKNTRISGKTEPKLHVCHIQTTFKFGAGATRRTFAVLLGLKKADYIVSLIVGREVENKKKIRDAGIYLYVIPDLQKYISSFKEAKAFYAIYRILTRILSKEELFCFAEKNKQSFNML